MFVYYVYVYGVGVSICMPSWVFYLYIISIVIMGLCIKPPSYWQF